MARIIAFVNQKGGVGKTTMAINFGCGIKNKYPKKKVLFIDMDAQCSLTYLLGIDNYQYDAFDMITKQCWIEDAICHTGIFDIVPASRKLASLENIMVGSKRETCLRRSIKYIKDQYDYIIIDCQPTLSFLTVTCLTAADDVIVPALPDVFSIQGINQLSDTMDIIRSRGENTNIRIAGIVVNRYNGRYVFNRQSMDVLKEIAESLNTKVFNSTIRESVTIREAQAQRVSIFQYTKNANQTEDFKNLVNEYLNDLKELEKE